MPQNREVLGRETMSTEVLKAMANPLRRRIMRALSTARSGRAADLAAQLEVPANQLSFHLRVLADAGLIEEAPELARDRRDRVWKPIRKARSLGSPEEPAADPALADLVLAGVIEHDAEVLRRVAVWARAYSTGEDPLVRGTLTDATLQLTRERFVELNERIEAVLMEFKADEPVEGTLAWDLVVAASSEEI